MLIVHAWRFFLPGCAGADRDMVACFAIGDDLKTSTIETGRVNATMFLQCCPMSPMTFSEPTREGGCTRKATHPATSILLVKKLPSAFRPRSKTLTGLNRSPRLRRDDSPPVAVRRFPFPRQLVLPWLKV
ncbi:uncharacterized protein LY79DRAFT_535602 [Colletotrichum navitas]|uniref:Secreted protein n=1 Tax=Colletotrichum navitas TaxID=681940 RepID=A0AAD8QEG5_9PEZI|nr:uncharacterized protein LY79DRAFT_535602 [Colletotrichum navitas]KAK1599609.1 hypothetical protein LY79DRAFT_535602 [Colletotrichum navitas]